MTTEKAFEQVKLAALEVKSILIEMDDNIQLSVIEAETIQHKVNVLSEQLIIYKFLKAQKELSPNFNLHLKVMEKSLPYEEVKSVGLNENQDINVPTNPIESPKVLKRIELGLNDKFRIINELFKHNSTEFNLVIDQLNSIESKEKSELYLNELMNLYKWKPDNELTIRLLQLNQKRFT